MKTTNQIIRPMLPSVLEQSIESLKRSTLLGIKSVEDVIYFVDNETNISKWVGACNSLNQDLGLTEEELVESNTQVRLGKSTHDLEKLTEKLEQRQRPIDIISRALFERVERALIKLGKSKSEADKIMTNETFFANIQRFARHIIMIYDGYTGEHQPKIFNIESNLWTKLVGTNPHKLTPDTFKMPFDTMVVRFDNHKHFYYTKLGAVSGQEKETGRDCILREFVVTSNGEGSFCFYFPFQPATVNIQPVDEKDTKFNITATNVADDFYTISISFNPIDSLFGATYKGRLIDKTMANAVGVFLKYFHHNCLLDGGFGPGVFETVQMVMSGFFNLLLYTNSVSAKMERVQPKRTPNINGKRTSTNHEVFNGYDTIKLVSNLIAGTGIAGTGRAMQCPKWDVRGHWRQQVIGEGRNDRKLIWIEPHTKGVLREEESIQSVTRDYIAPYEQEEIGS